MIRNLLSLAIVASFALCANAATIVTTTSAPTVGLPGFTTYTLTAQSDSGPIIGFNFANPNGFFGPMNQVNPFTLATIWTDLNAAMAPAHPSQDSQFLLPSNAGTKAGEFESTTSLRAAIAFTATPKVGPFAFVQLAIADDQEAEVTYQGLFQIAGTGGNIEEAVSGRVGGNLIPEPSTIALAGLALVGLVGYRRRK